MKYSCSSSSSVGSEEETNSHNSSNNINTNSGSNSSSDDDSSSTQTHEIIQLHGINNSTNSTNNTNNVNEFGDQIILIQDQSSSNSSKFSSLIWFQNLSKSLHEKVLKQKLRFVHREVQQDMKLKQRWILSTFILLAVLIVLFCTLLLKRNQKLSTTSYSQQLGITINLDELTERLKCPACFGGNLCPDLLQGKIDLHDWNKFRITRLANTKNIFYATWIDHGSEKEVVLKKLAHDHELEALDKAICDRHGKAHTCDVRAAVISLINTYSHKLSHYEPGDPFILHGEKIGEASDILLCPSHRKMEFLIDAHRKFGRGAHHSTLLANVLTTILVNPEPLYLQAFSSSDGWPFPAYYGACGRVIAEEYIGRRLTTYYKEPFHIRALIAKQLLEIANKFNQNPNNFILYMTDVSPDNFAVYENSNIVKIVDLENIIMVDKEVLLQSTVPNHDKLLVSESTYCRGKGNAENMCFSFSTEDLCERPRTDHNYYAICAGLLAPSPLADEFPLGLLHSVPSELNDHHFSQVLEICKNPANATVVPGLHLNDRIEAAQTLIELLGNYLVSHQNKKRK